MIFSPDTPAQERSWPRRMLNRLEVDRAVFYALALRGWQLAGGIVSMLLIGAFFSPEVQGYYYTFSGLVALQSFFELGLGTIMVAVASHEWARLNLNEAGQPAGDPQSLSRLAGVARLVARWYALVCGMFVLVVGTAGTVFFLRSGSEQVDWRAPWICLTVLSGALLWTMPLIALLEGCGQISVVNRVRLVQAICANTAVWAAIVAGGGLWAIVAAAAARLACDVILLAGRYRRFFEELLKWREGQQVDWRREIWPMQWRLALNGVFGYFAFAFFIPVIFDAWGPEEAGRAGMTWTLVTVLMAASSAWVQARVPAFGVLIARRDYAELDRVYYRVFRVSLGLMSLAAIAFQLMVAGLSYWSIGPANRILGPLPTSLFLLAAVLNHIPTCQNFYLRAHRREIVLLQNAISCTCIGVLVWLLGSRYGSTGAAAAYLGVTILVTVPYQTYLFQQFREEQAQTAA